jgi:UDPglucose 6-dehydrogenase
MKIAIAGTGYVGLVTGVCLASVGHEVICVDSDKDKIAALNNGIAPIFETGVERAYGELQRQDRIYLRL